MNKEDLKKGKIYKYKDAISPNDDLYHLFTFDSIDENNVICSKNYVFNGIGYGIVSNELVSNFADFNKDNISLATEEEIHWLNKCIMYGFLTKEEALRDFFKLPENWFLRLSNEQETSEIREYFSVSEFPSTTGHWYYLSDRYDNSRCKTRRENFPMSYKEITLEQFERYVLKKEISESINIDQLYTIDQIKEILLKEYIKEDVEEIIEVILTNK